MGDVAPADSTGSDWFLVEWAERAGLRQADFARGLEMLPSAANRIWRGRQPYSRDLINRSAAWLQIEPYELLMPPADAIALRALRRAAVSIADFSKGLPPLRPPAKPPEPKPDPYALAAVAELEAALAAARKAAAKLARPHSKT